MQILICFPVKLTPFVVRVLVSSHCLLNQQERNILICCSVVLAQNTVIKTVIVPITEVHVQQDCVAHNGVGVGADPIIALQIQRSAQIMEPLAHHQRHVVQSLGGVGAVRNIVPLKAAVVESWEVS